MKKNIFIAMLMVVGSLVITGCGAGNNANSGNNKVSENATVLDNGNKVDYEKGIVVDKDGNSLSLNTVKGASAADVENDGADDYDIPTEIRSKIKGIEEVKVVNDEKAHFKKYENDPSYAYDETTGFIMDANFKLSEDGATSGDKTYPYLQVIQLTRMTTELIASTVEDVTLENYRELVMNGSVVTVGYKDVVK